MSEKNNLEEKRLERAGDEDLELTHEIAEDVKGGFKSGHGGGGNAPKAGGGLQK